MPIIRFLALGLILLAGSAVAATPDSPLRPYTAQYKMSKSFITVAQGKFRLQHTSKGCYLFTAHAHASGVVSLFSGDRIEEESRFCIVNGQLRPQFYRFYHKDGKKNHNYTLTFDWGNRTVAVKRQGQKKATTRRIPPDAQDDLSMQIELRRRLMAAGGASAAPIQVHVVTRNHNRTYTFRIEGTQKLDTDAGSYKTLRMARAHPGDNQISFWVAPALDYLPVKVKRAGPGLELELTGLPQSPAAGAQTSKSQSGKSAPVSGEVKRHRRGGSNYQ